MFGTSHRAYVASRGEGYGRYSYTVTCSCGAQLGTYGSDSAANRAARQHEKAGK
jgi:hypothetical protein